MLLPFQKWKSNDNFEQKQLEKCQIIECASCLPVSYFHCNKTVKLITDVLFINILIVREINNNYRIDFYLNK